MKQTILIVDDNTEMLETLSDELIESYEIIIAHDGQQALDKLRDADVRVVICDVTMPVMDGFEFCRIVKSTLEYSHVPVILLTARNTLQSRITGLEIGADAYIEKPFDVEHLLVQVANLIANRNKLKRYYVTSPVANLKSIAHTVSDENFVAKLSQTILDNLYDENFDIEKLSKLMNTSRTSLFRKISSISSLTPNELINVSRLKKAAQLLAETDFKIFEIAYMVGFSSQTSFGRSFYKQFGMNPTEYQKQKHI